MIPFSFTQAFLVACLAFALPVQAVPAPVVDLGYARYQGMFVADKVTNATHTEFLGIRYAAPPTGARRFRAPAPPEATPGVQLAGSQALTCLQAGQGNSPDSPFRPGQHKRAADLGASEDCLFLNVYVPGSITQKKSLPVIFWIHGGGYVAGSTSGLDGNNLIRESGEGVIIVLAQYRLGLFGFLPGQKVKEGGDLNAGLLDQQFALRWLQEHISKFGGDPDKVTIWGQSAGAGSVLQHVVANGGMTKPPLFRAAITSSTFLPSQYAYNDRIPELLYSEAVNQVNCSSATDTLECLREAEADVLEAVNTNINQSGFFGTFVFVPVVDGTLITDRPTQVLRRGRLNGKISYSVTNPMEGADFVNQSIASTVQVADYVSQLFPNLQPPDIDGATRLYAGLGSNISQVIAIMGESIFICPTYYLLRGFGGNAFKGEFALPPGNHAQDVPYYFSNGLPPPFADPDFDNAFADSFADFAISLNTNIRHNSSIITPTWPLWMGTNEMVFNMTESGSPIIKVVKTSNTLLRRCE
ncbi:hypothetical protein D9613_008001 [Agrocybe pediades]|uniref:Carboxylic ester hydrolase n=1 Tax=Agrocybe pediades TaxID=84607 RepID=A0A8H4VNG0_9AGAR|nr:hypothetical protein D9613_008001 [Agrocybe pediades]